MPAISSQLRRLVWCGEHRFTLQIHDGGPVVPGRGQVVIKVRAAGLCATDLHILNGRFPQAQPPRVLGHEIAGDVVVVGDGVTRVRAGQKVTVDSVVGCGDCFFCRRGSTQFCTSGYELGVTADGGCQDYLLVPERNVYPVDASISYEEAAILDMEVWGALRKCGIRPGESVLILGDGPAGMLACQVARLMGADRVILCGRSPGRLEAARRMGLADRYIISTQEDVAAVANEESGGRGIDLIVDCAGTARTAADALRVAAPGGRVLLYGVYENPLRECDLNQVVLKDLTIFGALSDRVGWEEVIALVASGALKLNPLITHRFPLEDAPAGYRLIEARADGVVKAVLVL